jgi:hypothetical protein
MKKFLCWLGIHKWLKSDGRGGVFCENKCYNCGEYKDVKI